MSKLERTSVGRFSLDAAVTVDRLREAQSKGCLADMLIPMADALADMPSVALDADSASRAIHGLPVAVDGPLETGAAVRMMSAEGELLAIGVVAEEGELTLVKPRKVLGG